MKKATFKTENIGKIVRLLPLPKMNGKWIAQSRNFWLIVRDYNDEGEGIEVLHKITNHGGKIPFDSIREWREPDMVILSAQLNLGKAGVFNLSPFLDGPEAEMMTEEEILPERLTHAETVLGQCTPEQRKAIRELLVREKMTQEEIVIFSSKNGIPDGHKFYAIVNGLTSFLERDGKGFKSSVWIKPGFVPVLSKLLLQSQGDKDATVIQISRSVETSPSAS